MYFHHHKAYYIFIPTQSFSHTKFYLSLYTWSSDTTKKNGPSDLKVESRGGVAIVLSPTSCEAWRAAGSKPPITTPMNSPFVGRFIGVKLKFPRIDPYKNKVQGKTTFLVASIYHPVDELKHTEFIDILSTIMSSVPKNANFIGGNDVNANLGIRSKMYGKTLGPWGINNRNMQGRRLLGFFSNNQLKIANSFYKKASYVTWRSFNKTRSPHMLDVISVSKNFYKCVRNCGI